jgi:hypothetical protein
VYVNGGVLEMNGGEISGNSAGYLGGGVYLGGAGSEFTMSGEAKITSNTVTMNGDHQHNDTTRGGGVYFDSPKGSFTMDGGEVSGNSVSGATSIGGGVAFAKGDSFTMKSGAVIKNNTVSSTVEGSFFGQGGGGVYAASGVVVMEDGVIIENNTVTSASYAFGGGVYVALDCVSFTMKNGAIIRNNTAESTTESGPYGYAFGGGIKSDRSLFIEGGTISGNKAVANGFIEYREVGRDPIYEPKAHGGGIYLNTGCAFAKTGGILYGSDGGANANKAVRRNGDLVVSGALSITGAGHAAYLNGARFFRDLTAGTGDNMSSQ